jgi:hypothetical protein
MPRVSWSMSAGTTAGLPMKRPPATLAGTRCVRRKTMRTWYRYAAAATTLAVALACSDGSLTNPGNHLQSPNRPALTQVSNAGYTTVNVGVDGSGHCANGNPNVNCNIYDVKSSVWMNGGPVGVALGDGTYFFAVLSPSGQNAEVNDGTDATADKGTPHNLSDDFDAYTNRTFSISGGTVSYSGLHDFDSNKIRLADYSNTLNPGGVYIMAICKIQDAANNNLYPVDPSSCKYDAFKVQESECTVDCGGGPAGILTIDKFYDTNADGVYDVLTDPIIGWQVFDNFVQHFTPYADNNAPPGDHVVSEGVPTSPAGWFISHKDIGSSNLLGAPVSLQTATATDLTVTVTVTSNATAAVLFGNYCQVGSGGFTLGFWSNPNGKLVLSANDPAWRNFLNDAANHGTLWKASASKNGTITTSIYTVPGGAFNSAFSSFSAWLTSGNASNNGSALYMLSVQYVAMELNILYKGVDPNAYYPAAGKTIGALMTDVKNELNAGPNGTSRTYETSLIKLLDYLNNGGKVVAAPHTCTPAF